VLVPAYQDKKHSQEKSLPGGTLTPIDGEVSNSIVEKIPQRIFFMGLRTSILLARKFEYQ